MEFGSPENWEQHVVFSLDYQLCSLAIQEVVEIIKIQSITNVPNVPVFLEGVVNLRGNIIPIVNMRKRYGMDEIPYDKKTRIIIVRVEDEEIGLIVDEVKKVIDLDEEAINSPNDLFNMLEKDNFIGFTKKSDQLIGIMNLKHVLYQHGQEVKNHV